MKTRSIFKGNVDRIFKNETVESLKHCTYNIKT